MSLDSANVACSVISDATDSVDSVSPTILMRFLSSYSVYIQDVLLYISREFTAIGSRSRVTDNEGLGQIMSYNVIKCHKISDSFRD